MRTFRPLLRSPYARSSLAFVAAAVPFAYQVREKLYENQARSESVTNPIAPEQRVERRWTLEDATGSHSPRRINTVKVSTPGLTFISAAGGADRQEDGASTRQIGSVRVSGDKEELLECVEVVSLQPNGLEIRFKKDAPAVAGHLLAELSLNQDAQVNVVEASGGGVVVVEDNVLVTNCAHADVSLSLRGHGELFVSMPAEAVSVKSLLLSVAGSGRLQFEVSELVAADDVLLQIAGSGYAGVFARAKLHAPTVKASIVGAGHAVTATRDLAARKLKSSIAGYGEVKHLGPGRTNIQRVSVTGSGSVSSKETVSESATVRIIGSGDATLDVKDVLDASCRGWGVVRYVNSPPNTVNSKTSLSLERARATMRKPSPEDKLSAASRDVPTRENAFGDVSVQFDPKAFAKEQRAGSLDVFGAISAVKNALNDRSERRSERRRDHKQQEEQQREFDLEFDVKFEDRRSRHCHEHHRRRHQRCECEKTRAATGEQQSRQESHSEEK